MNLPQLKENWTEAWAWLSNWLTVALAAAPILYVQLPQYQAYIGPKLFTSIMGMLALLNVLNTIRAKPAP